MFRRVTRFIHAVDHAIGRLAGRRRVLVELRTPVYHAVLGPVVRGARRRFPDVDSRYTSEYPDRIKPLVAPSRFITHADAEWRRFDLYVNADPWAAARLRRCARPRSTSSTASPASTTSIVLPACRMGFEYDDRVAFINRDRMARYLGAGLVTPAQAALVGYPEARPARAGGFDGRGGPRRRSGLARPARRRSTRRPTRPPPRCTLPAKSIVRALAGRRTERDRQAARSVARLRTRDTPAASTGARACARSKALRPESRYVEDSPMPRPLLAAADVMVTDHSSVGFEFLVLDRPLLVFDAPELPRAARINPEKIALLRQRRHGRRTPSTSWSRPRSCRTALAAARYRPSAAASRERCFTIPGRPPIARVAPHPRALLASRLADCGDPGPRAETTTARERSAPARRHRPHRDLQPGGAARRDARPLWRGCACPPGRRWEAIVVDNNSTDDTRAVVERHVAGFPVPLRYLFEAAQGRSSALNAGIAAAQRRSARVHRR